MTLLYNYVAESGTGKTKHGNAKYPYARRRLRLFRDSSSTATDDLNPYKNVFHYRRRDCENLYR